MRRAETCQIIVGLVLGAVIGFAGVSRACSVLVLREKFVLQAVSRGGTAIKGELLHEIQVETGDGSDVTGVTVDGHAFQFSSVQR